MRRFCATDAYAKVTWRHSASPHEGAEQGACVRDWCPIDSLMSYWRDILIFRMSESTTIQIRQRGTLTLPAALREKYGLADGDPLTLVDLDGAILLTPKVLTVPRLAEQLERLRRKKGLELKDLGGPRRED